MLESMQHVGGILLIIKLSIDIMITLISNLVCLFTSINKMQIIFLVCVYSVHGKLNEKICSCKTVL